LYAASDHLFFLFILSVGYDRYYSLVLFLISRGVIEPFHRDAVVLNNDGGLFL